VTTDELPVHHVEAYDVFLSFTRASPGAAEQAARLENALVRKGLRVFRDVLIDEFAGITAELVNALAGSKVLVAYYTREYPGRYACQWELTAAFVAAQREGDPRRRVLVVNPEVSPAHIRPVELADAKYATTPHSDVELDQLASRIAERVAEAHGPLGASPHPVDRARLPADVLAPRRLVGRYPEMWEVHTALHAMDLPGVHKPAPEPAIVVTGLSGMGKSSVVARYAYLYRDAYPGGVFWIGPFGADQHTFLGSYTDQLRRIADEQLGLEVDGVEPDRLRAMVANALNHGRHKVLWIVDGIPPALPAEVLRQVLVPAHNVRTILTSRSHVVDSDVPELALSGLDAAEVSELLGLSTSDVTRDFAERCGGHPVVVRAAANALRYRPGTVTPQMVRHLLRGAESSVGTALDVEVGGVSPLARQVLRVAGVLAPAPFPPELAGRLPNDLAVKELVRRGLLHVVGAHWWVHPLVSEAAGTDRALAEQVAGELLPLLTAGGAYLSEHALRLGKRPDVRENTRRRLLRHVVADHEAKGDLVAAGEVVPALLALTAPGETPVTDLITGARVRLATGRPEEAVEIARQAIDATAATDDFRARHRARLLLAQALDQLGDHSGADEACWTGLVSRLPGWFGEESAAEERERTRLALASATFLRGKPRDALAIVEPMVARLRAAPPGPLRDDVAPMATLELARLLQITGKARVARGLAEQVVRHYRDNGMGAHVRLLEAESIWADAFLTLDLAELDGKQENWERSQQKLRELATRYTEQWGEDSAVAVAARVRADRALIALGTPRDALRALAETEAWITGRRGQRRLLYRVRHAIGQAHAQLHEFGRQRDILLAVLPAQTALLGRYHPETLETQLDLGIAYAMTGDRANAVTHVDEAAAALRRGLGMNVDLSGKATTAQGVVRLPTIALSAMSFLGKLL
jgi:tetratricopeptide (TPR) repeat protein